MSNECCTYGCIGTGKDCPARADQDHPSQAQGRVMEAHFYQNEPTDNSGIDWKTFKKSTATQPIDMFEPNGWIATMEWLRHTILPCLVSVVVGVVVTTIYFLTRG